MMNYFHQKFFLGCANINKERPVKQSEPGQNGIIENYYYAIVDIREVKLFNKIF